MEKQIDCRGQACPLPVVNAKKEVEAFTEDGTLHVRVDNDTAVQNLSKFAKQRGFEVSDKKDADDDFTVTMQVKKAGAKPDAQDDGCCCEGGMKTAVVISSNQMGNGEEALGKTLMKAFIFALTSQDTVPDYIIFYNSGAYVSCEDSDSIEDLKALEKAGAQIMTCGTCLNFYELTEKLAVGSVSNMYDIVETQMKCTRIIRP
ncbi:MAG: sulfurtransferase-like selenium metabolism protein YedF [Lachnospiraceae bacterium]|nr:sulfurtransferase-like selenium metabolism protein YedF [Lachnospiraceae bacterium]